MRWQTTRAKFCFRPRSSSASCNDRSEDDTYVLSAFRFIFHRICLEIRKYHCAHECQARRPMEWEMSGDVLAENKNDPNGIHVRRTVTAPKSLCRHSFENLFHVAREGSCIELQYLLNTRKSALIDCYLCERAIRVKPSID